jgi:hypothetical protein
MKFQDRVKPRTGWCVCKVHNRNVRPVCPEYCPEDAAYTGISYSPVLFCQKQTAKSMCDELNERWTGRPFVVRKMRLEETYR